MAISTTYISFVVRGWGAVMALFFPEFYIYRLSIEECQIKNQTNNNPQTQKTLSEEG